MKLDYRTAISEALSQAISRKTGDLSEVHMISLMERILPGSPATTAVGHAKAEL